MTEVRGQDSRRLPPGAATRHLKRTPSQSSGLRFPFEFCFAVLGRDVIAITSVGGQMLEWSKTIPGETHVPRRTAAMAMAALPEAGIQVRDPHLNLSTRTRFPIAETRDLRMTSHFCTFAQAAGRFAPLH